MNFKRYNVAVAYPESDLAREAVKNLGEAFFGVKFNVADFYLSEKPGVVAFVYPAEYAPHEKWVASIPLGEAEYPQTLSAAMEYVVRLRNACLREFAKLVDTNPVLR